MRILLVEDDRKVAGFLAKGLREESYSVDVCGDGEEALESALATDYDVIILDVMLPKKNGFAVCQELRRRSVFTPVIMLTARDALDDKVSGLERGADDYLTKPFSFVELLARIRALMRRSQDYKGTILKAADLELDPAKRQVTRGGKAVTLTGKEYALLEFLMRNRGRIVTTTMILEHVWDMNYDGFGNVVSVTMNHLRGKVDGDFPEKLIQTVRGRGYTIHEDPKA